MQHLRSGQDVVYVREVQCTAAATGRPASMAWERLGDLAMSRYMVAEAERIVIGVL